jgi:MFS family permease
VFGLFAVYGLYVGFTQGVSKALIADHSPKELKGTAMGVYYFVTGFATLAASLMTGLLWDHYSPALAFQVCAGLAVLSAVLVPLTALWRRRRGSAPA